MTELALDTELTAEQREYLELARVSAHALLAVVGDVLDFAKIEAGQLELERVPFELARLVDEVVRGQAVHAQAKGLELVLRIRPGLPEVVVGDPLRVQRVLLNLLSNAIKFTRRGEVVVEVENGEWQGDEGEVAFTVRDTGMGIAERNRKAIFEAFRQADSSTTRRFGGTGLGLAIAQELVELMGGALTVESEQGVGSTFRFTIQVGRAGAAELPPGITPPSPLERIGRVVRMADGATAAAGRTICRILVAEDNLVTRHHLTRLLERLGHRPTVVGSGVEVLSALASASFDLVLMDVQMPDLDGLAATAELRRREAIEGGHVPVLVVTASALAGDRERCLAAGADGYLTKPVRRTQLAAAIAELVAPLPAASAPRLGLAVS
jgi:CheY-like chemotaxis protein